MESEGASENKEMKLEWDEFKDDVNLKVLLSDVDTGIAQSKSYVQPRNEDTEKIYRRLKAVRKFAVFF